MKFSQEKERLSLFMAYGLQSNHLERYYSEYMLKRESTLKHIVVAQKSPIVELDSVKVKKFNI